MLWFPTVLLVNHITAFVITQIINKKISTKLKITDVYKVINIIYRYKLRGGGKIELCDIQSSDSEMKIVI